MIDELKKIFTSVCLWLNCYKISLQLPNNVVLAKHEKWNEISSFVLATLSSCTRSYTWSFHVLVQSGRKRLMNHLPLPIHTHILSPLVASNLAAIVAKFFHLPKKNAKQLWVACFHRSDTCARMCELCCWSIGTTAAVLGRAKLANRYRKKKLREAETRRKREYYRIRN